MKKTDKKSARERELEILRRMHEDDEGGQEKFTPASNAAKTKESGDKQDKKEDKNKADRICPKCGSAVGNISMCPHCGYRGYMPMSEKKLKRTRLILYPIFLAVAILVYLYVKGYFG